MMFLRRLQTVQIRLIIIYVLLILVAMQLIGIYFIRTLEESFYGNFQEKVNNEAFLLAEYVEDYLDVAETETDRLRTYDDLNIFISNLFASNDTEIQVIDANGVIVSASGQQTSRFIGQKNAQIEVSRALQGIRSDERILMDAEGNRKLSLAMPVRQEDKVIGAVYIVSSMEGLFETMNRIKQFLFTGTLIALVMTTVLSILLSNMITAPIKEITSKAVAIAVGNLNQRVNIQSKDEIGQLGRAFNDMTTRLKDALSSIEDEKEKLDSVLSNMNDGVIGTDEHRRLIIMNLRARSMLNIRAEERIEGEEVLQLLGLETNVVPPKAWTEGATIIVPLRAKMQHGEALTVKMTFTPIHRRGVGVTGTVLLLHDITEQQKLEESRKEFVANVSHELRTPLTTIKSYLEALDEGAIEEPTLAHKFVHVTRNETERMIRLVSDLLHLSKYDSQQKKIRREITNIVPILEEVADRFAFQAQQRGIDFVILPDKGLQPVNIDRDEIDQVLDNLISNAIKYSPDGGFITMTASKINQQWAEVTVTDQGIGIPQKELSRVFERFYRVDKARSRDMGGTGLGLNIALEIVRAHGGMMKIESEQGAGTMVKFTLPHHTEDHDEA